MPDSLIVKPDAGTVNSSLANLAAALSAAQAEITPPKKSHTATVPTKTGGSYSYKYSTLDEIIEVLRGPLGKHGLSFIQPIVQEAGRAGVSTVILHKSGEAYDAGAVLLPCGDTPQAMGSALTYARRYALSAAFGIAAEDDDDGAQAERSARKANPPKAAPAAAPKPPAREPGDEPDAPPEEPDDIAYAMGEDTNALRAAREARLRANDDHSTPRISEGQQKRLFARAKSARWETAALRAMLVRFGWEHSNQIPTFKYDDLIALIDEGPTS